MGPYGLQSQAFQNADPLIALRHKEFSHIFAAFDGLQLAVLPEQGLTDADPFVCKLCGRMQQRHKISGKRGAAARFLGPGDPLQRNLDDAKILFPGDGGGIQKGVQALHLRTRRSEQPLPMIPLSHFHCLCILPIGFLSAHFLFHPFHADTLFPCKAYLYLLYYDAESIFSP